MITLAGKAANHLRFGHLGQKGRSSFLVERAHLVILPDGQQQSRAEALRVIRAIRGSDIAKYVVHPGDKGAALVARRVNLSCNICCTTTAATKNALHYWLQGASDQGVCATQRIIEQSAKERMKDEGITHLRAGILTSCSLPAALHSPLFTDLTCVAGDFGLRLICI